MTTMIELINERRRANGLAALEVNDALIRAAAAHARDLAGGGVVLDGWQSHIGSDGSDVVARVRREGYAPELVLEMTVWGWDGDEKTQLEYWWNSSTHRAIILNPVVTEIGAARVYRTGTKWEHYGVVVVGKGVGAQTPAPEPAPPAGGHVVLAPVVAAPAQRPSFDLLAYMRGDGRSYRVGNARGSFEVFQTQVIGDTFYQVKAWDDLSIVNWEQFGVSGDTITRDVDTSPGDGRFYRQFGAPWVRRFMRIGESFAQAKQVQFFRLEDCQPIYDGFSGHDVTDTIRLEAHYSSYTFRSNGWEPVRLDDVILLRWVEGGEFYYFARGFGLVAWEREHQDPNSPRWSAISEMRPDVGVLERLRVGCL